ncbi:MAG: AzlC family ABC transporter permease [Chloroflexi bacterium]|nr:AzlC family ABC transporter permease [Chloroflexota bacterium]
MSSEFANNPRRLAAIHRGFRATLPVALSVVPFGLAFGAVAADAAPPWQAVLMSAAIFAGTAQFVCISMLAQGAAALPVLVTGILINLRLLLLSAALMPHVRRAPKSLRPFLAHLLTDESFAVSMAEFEARGGDICFYLGSGLAIFTFWQVSTWAGLFFGAAIPQGLGFEFALPASLICLLFLLLRTRSQAVVAALTAIVALLARAVVSSTWSAMLATLLVVTLAVPVLRMLRRGRS